MAKIFLNYMNMINNEMMNNLINNKYEYPIRGAKNTYSE